MKPKRTIIATILLLSTLWSFAQPAPPSVKSLAVNQIVPPVTIDKSARGVVKLEWNRSTDSRAVGYRVHFTTNASLVFNSVTSAGNNTNVTLNLQEGLVWYFAVSSVDTNGQSGDLSNVVTNEVFPVLQIQPYSYAYRYVAKPGSTNTVQESSDAKSWSNTQTIVASATGEVLFVRTNTGGNRFVRLKVR